MEKITIDTTATAAIEQPKWTDAEHDEIMRLHIIEGLIIGDAMRQVIDKRSAEGNG